MNSEPSEEIERKLAELRASLARDARAAVSDARALTDWRYHLRAHPWLALGGALAVGWLAVPRRGMGLAAPAAVNHMAANVHSALNRGGAESLSVTAPGLGRTLLGMAATYAVKESLGYLTHLGRTMIERHSAEPAPPKAEPGLAQHSQ